MTLDAIHMKIQKVIYDAVQLAAKLEKVETELDLLRHSDVRRYKHIEHIEDLECELDKLENKLELLEDMKNIPKYFN